MYSLEVLHKLNGHKPRKIIDANDIFGIPNGTEGLNTDGYTEIDTLFCDSSGLGSASEPALTVKKLRDIIQWHLDRGGKLYGAITGEGQFQVYITLYKKVGE